MIFKSYLVEQNLNLLNKNLFLFFGENLGLKNDFKDLIVNNSKDTEIVTFLQDNIIKNNDAFFSEIFNISLFKKKKIYFVNQVNDKLLDLIKIFENKIDNQKIYFFAEQLEKKSKLRNYFEKSANTGAIACYADNELNIRKIILQKLKDFEGLSPQNINIILDNCNLDRIKLNNEIDKIISFFTNKKIDTNNLAKLLNVKINDDFNLLKDEALIGNKINTNKLLSDTLLETEKNILYLNIINHRLTKLSEVNQLVKNSNLEEAINALKPPIFWKDKPKFMMQIKKWDREKIRKILNKTYNLEVEIKSSTSINKNLNMKKLIIDICVLANAS